MTRSPLADAYIPAYAGNYSPASYSAPFKGVVIHHMAGCLSVEQCGAVFQSPGRNGSTHYGVRDGRIACYVDEECVAWANSDWDANCSRISMELSNSEAGGDWPVSDATFDAAARLCADILKRYGHASAVKGQNITWHQMYSATACPGPYMLARMDGFVSRVNAHMQGTAAPVVPAGVDVQVYSPNATKAQRWLLDGPDADGFFTIKATTPSGKCLDVAYAGTDAGARVWAYTPNGTDAQKWRVEVADDEGLVKLCRITPKVAPALALDVQGGSHLSGTKLWTWPDNATPAQRWALVPAGSKDTYTILSAVSGLALDISGGV